VRKLILVGSGPFEAQYSSAIRATKMSRLTNEERAELKTFSLVGEDAVARFIALSDVADTYERDTSPQPSVRFDRTIHAAVWPEADGMRKSGALLDAVTNIQCPVLAIHGDYDPRPSAGVRIPLQAALPAAQFAQLGQCGHKPWQEIHAKDDFYRLVENALA
jgi:pimeloyl-ACP methyl ester carboxylesterase